MENQLGKDATSLQDEEIAKKVLTLLKSQGVDVDNLQKENHEDKQKNGQAESPSKDEAPPSDEKKATEITKENDAPKPLKTEPKDENKPADTNEIKKQEDKPANSQDNSAKKPDPKETENFDDGTSNDKTSVVPQAEQISIQKDKISDIAPDPEIVEAIEKEEYWTIKLKKNIVVIVLCILFALIVEIILSFFMKKWPF